MKTKFSFWINVFILMLYCSTLWAIPKKSITVDYAMHMAEVNSPLLSAEQFREIAAQKSVSVARSAYFPTLNAEAIDSAGFPGSTSALEIEGLMGSPFRKELAGGIVAEQTICDFGRTAYNVAAAKHEADSTHENTKITVYQIKQLTLQIYYDCAKFRTLRDTWSQLSKESAIITKEAQHFVNTGQVSIVDRYLSKAEMEQALTAKAFYAEQLEQSVRQLSVLMGVPSQSITCPRLPKELTPSLNPNTPLTNSPFLSRAVADSYAAQARLGQERAGLLPRIVAVASVGDMQEVRLVTRKGYSVGVGVIMPVFDMNTHSRIQRAAALAIAKHDDVAAEKLFLEEENAKYAGVIDSSKVQLQHLFDELQIAKKAYQVAKDRYFNFEGNLIDLREAFRNLARVETEAENTQAQILQAKGSKALLNGSSQAPDY